MSKIPEQILQAGCTAYCSIFLNGIGSFGEAIEEAYFAIHDHEDWVRAGPAAWNGEGLPPVGTELEAGFACEEFETWHKGVCVAVGEDPEGREEFCVVKFGNKLAMYTYEGRHMRPIRTPEQIAAEKREAEILEIFHATGLRKRDGGREVAEAIYRAGYRKQVAQ